jgi:hypothetical protein
MIDTRGTKTPQRAYREPILRILATHHGRATRTAVLKELERDLGATLTEFDRSDIRSGSIRWQKSAEWEISTMRQEGLLKPQNESPRGEWCLTPAGAKLAGTL